VGVEVVTMTGAMGEAAEAVDTAAIATPNPGATTTGAAMGGAGGAEEVVTVGPVATLHERGARRAAAAMAADSPVAPTPLPAAEALLLGENAHCMLGRCSLCGFVQRWASPECRASV